MPDEVGGARRKLQGGLGGLEFEDVSVYGYGPLFRASSAYVEIQPEQLVVTKSQNTPSTYAGGQPV